MALSGTIFIGNACVVVTGIVTVKKKSKNKETSVERRREREGRGIKKS